MADRRRKRPRPGAVAARSSYRSALDPALHVYGTHPVAAAISAQRRSVEAVHTTGDGRRRLEAALGAVPAGITTVEHEPQELDRLTGDAAHQGLAAELGPYPYLDEHQLLATLSAGDIPCRIIALDEVSDPHNLGAVARTCEAIGAGLLIPERRAAHVTASACAASAGALERIPVARCRNLHDALIECKRQIDGLWVYGLDAAATQTYSDMQLDGDVVLVFGSEGRGIRPRVAAACDALLTIPMRGDAGSLNVSVAAGVVAFEAERQQRARGAGA